MAVAAGMGCRRSVRSVRGKTVWITASISLVPIIPMLLLLLPRFHEALSPAQRRELILRSRIRTGMRLSGEARHNITAAEEACAVWEKVLQPQNGSSSGNENGNENGNGSNIVDSMSPDVLALSKTLYASCLVRVGRDAEAVAVYDSCLEDCYQNAAREGANNESSSARSTSTATATSTATWRLSKARCLQRLLRYSSAAVEYEKVVADLRHGMSTSMFMSTSTATTRDDRTEARLGAATCILRSTGDVPRARRVLDESGESDSDRDSDRDTHKDNDSHSDTNKKNTIDNDDASLSERSARLLSIALGYLETGVTRETIEQLKDALDNGTGDDASTRPCFLLYRWILGALEEADDEVEAHAKTTETTEIETRHDSPRSNSELAATLAMAPEQLFLELIRINTSPLDDPHLLRLDDKIELHQLLTHNNDNNNKSSSSSSNNNNGITWPSYWPEGIVLPDALSGNESKSETFRLARQTGDKPTTSRLWISKTRAGYGSHGNQILTTAEAEETVRAAATTAATTAVEQLHGRETLSSKAVGAAAASSSATGAVEQEQGEPFLLQQMVDPLVLLRGCKFSLRIYVVVFSFDEAYISSKGLVKLASRPLIGNNEEASPDHHDPLDPSMHMTNSGRETQMQQEDLDFLWNELDQTTGCDNENENEGKTYSDRDKTTVSDRGGPPSSELWNKICRVAADVVLVRYPERTSSLERRNPDPSEREEQRRVWRERRTEWGIPKILGLDFVIQDGREPVPWLVEVNRFPGLEPRDEADRAIKYRVVGDAWKKASERRRQRQRQLGELSLGGTKSAVGFEDTLFDLLSANGGDDSDSSLERLEF